MTLSNNKILITGGATGIGFGLAERFVEEGNTVIICGRRESALAEAASLIPTLLTKVCDLSIPAERAQLYQWILEEHADVNVLVNNAGIQNWMSVQDADFYEKSREEIAVNIEAPLHLVTLFLKLPAINTIINVTSGLSFVPLTKVPVYSATKAFFHSFTLSLQHLLKPKGIEVIEIIPPALNTDLGGKGLHDQAPMVSNFTDAVFEQLKAGTAQVVYGFSEDMLKAGPAELETSFKRMNGSM